MHCAHWAPGFQSTVARMRNPQLQSTGNDGKVSGQEGAGNASSCPNRREPLQEIRMALASYTPHGAVFQYAFAAVML